jgi:hypothetical protein
MLSQIQRIKDGAEFGVCIVGNKSDLEGDRVVYNEQGKARNPHKIGLLVSFLLKKYGMNFVFFVSFSSYNLFVIIDYVFIIYLLCSNFRRSLGRFGHRFSKLLQKHVTTSPKRFMNLHASALEPAAR